MFVNLDVSDNNTAGEIVPNEVIAIQPASTAGVWQRTAIYVDLMFYFVFRSRCVR